MKSSISLLDFLKGVDLFSGLSEPDLQKLVGMLKVKRLAPGEQLFPQGGLGESAYIIQEGEVEITRISDGREVTLAVRRHGEVVGEMATLEKGPRMASARALGDCVLLAIGREPFEQLLSSSPAASRSILATVTSRLREAQALLQQSERMAQLGIMTAGMAHELNNPASAALRGAGHLRNAVRDLQDAYEALFRLGLIRDRWEELQQRLADARERARTSGSAGSLERTDRQEALEEWLEAHGQARESARSAELAEMGYRPADLDELLLLFPPPAFPLVITLISTAFLAESLAGEISRGAREIAEIVKALKSYVYLDQGPVQDVDVHEGIENTLIILRHKLKTGITVRRDFAGELPRVAAHGSELNQVWTNLIDNAVDALDGKGEIVLRTRRDDSRVVVEVEDNGPGIPAEVQPRVFTLFFTTKPLGKGSGQGLNISYGIVRRDGGTIDFQSRPGRTVFTVRLPASVRGGRPESVATDGNASR